MKIELTEEQIKLLATMLNKQYCPSCIYLPEIGYNPVEFRCKVSCRKCWKSAIKSLEIKEEK